MLHESGVAGRPGHERLRLRSWPFQSRGEVEQPGPRARLLHRHAVVVAAGVVHEPLQAIRSEVVLRQPLAHRDAVEFRHDRIVGAGRHGNGERLAALAVAPARPLAHLGVEARELCLVLARLPDVKVEPFVPASPEEGPFLRIATQHLLGDDRRAVRMRAFDDAEFLEQRDEEFVLGERRGDVVRPPRVRPDGGFASARGAAGCGFEFEKYEIGDAGVVEAPRRRKPGDAPTDDDESVLLPGIGSGNGSPAIAEAMPQHIRWPDNFTRRQRRHAVRVTTRCHQCGRAEKGGQ